MKDVIDVNSVDVGEETKSIEHLRLIILKYHGTKLDVLLKKYENVILDALREKEEEKNDE